MDADEYIDDTFGKTATDARGERLARDVWELWLSGLRPRDISDMLRVRPELVRNILSGRRLAFATTERRCRHSFVRCPECGILCTVLPCLTCEINQHNSREHRRKMIGKNRQLVRSTPVENVLHIRPTTSVQIHVRAESHNAEDRSFEAVLITENQTTSMDAWTLEPVVDVVLMDGVEFVDPLPIVDSHVASLYSMTPTTEIRGHVVDIVDATVDGVKAKVGRLRFDKDEKSEELYQKVLSGSVKNLSPGYTITHGVELSPGESAAVGGTVYTAPDDKPLLVGTRSRVTEISAVLRGADPACRIRSARETSKRGGDTSPGVFPPLPSQNENETTMSPELKKFLIRCGLNDTASNKDAEAFMETLEGEQLAEAKRLRGAPAPQPPAPTPKPTDDAARIRAEERQRIARIEELAGDDTPRELVRSAIEEGWDEGRASTAFLQAMRDRRSQGGVPGGAPAAHIRNQSAPGVQALVLSQLMRAGIQPDDPILGSSRLRTAMHGYGGAYLCDEARAVRSSGRFSDAYSREIDFATQLMAADPRDFARALLRAQGVDEPLSAKELIRTAFSSADLSGTLDTIVYARMALAFERTPDWTRGFVAEGNNSDLKSSKRVRIGGTGRMVTMARGATPNLVGLADDAPTVKSERKAAQIVLDEIDLINGEWGALESRAIEELAQIAIDLRAEIVISMLLRAETQTYSGDETPAAVASTGRGNLITSAVLDAGNLEAARALLTTAKFGGRVITQTPRFLVTPEAMWGQANRLLNSTELRSDASQSTVADAVLTPTSNSAVRAMNLTHLSDGRFDAGVPDPNDPAGVANVAGDNDRFYLCAGDRNAPIELTGLNGYGAGGAPELEAGPLEGGARGRRFTAVSFIAGNWVNPNGLIVLRP